MASPDASECDGKCSEDLGADTKPRLTDAEVAHFIAHRVELDAVADARHGESAYFADASPWGRGMRNLGATCYMNSLLQGLFMTLPFRRRVYEWKYDPAVHGPEAASIPRQLQILFARLQLAETQAVDPTNVTRSFGWSAADACRQQDLQEMLIVLFGALDRTPPAPGGVPGLLTSPFKTRLVNSIRAAETESCGHCRSRKEAVLDIRVQIEGFPTIEESLGALTTPELLTGDNKWRCEACACKVDALKGTQLSAVDLPEVLVVQLRRFSFDFQLLRRTKIQDTFKFGRHLVVDPFTDEAGVAQSSGGSPTTSSSSPAHRYELYAIMIHHGTAYGGHYWAIIKHPGTEGVWAEYNDRQVRVISEADMCAALGTPTAAAAAASSEDRTAAAALGPPGGEAATEGGKGEEAETVAAAADAGTTLSRIQAAVNSNACLLFYRRLQPSRAAEVGDGPAAATAGRKEAAAGSGDAGGAEGAWDVPSPPAELVDMIEGENRQFLRLKGLHKIKRRMVELAVFADEPVTLLLPGHITLAEATDRAYEALIVRGEGSADKKAEAEDTGDAAGTGTGEVDEAKAAAAEIAAMLDDGGGGVTPAGKLPPPTRDCVRLRRYDPMSARRMETYSGKEGEAVERLFHHVGVVAILERRVPGEEWAEYDPDEMVVRVARWDEEHPEACTDPDVTTLVRVVGGKAAATVGNLKAAVATVLRMPMAWQRLVEVTDRRARVLAGDEKRLVADLSVWPGADIVVELRAEDGREVDADSPAVAFYDQSRNLITLEVNSTPGTPEGQVLDGGDGEFDLRLEARLTEPLGDVLGRLATQLGRAVQEIHVRRRPGGDRLKDTAATLRDLHLSDGGVLFVCEGSPLAADEYLLKVWRYDARTKPRMKFLLNTPAAESLQVGALKRRIAEGIPSHPPDRIRLRVKNGQSLGKVLRDDATVQASFSRLADGTEIAAQLLDEPETITSRHMLLSIRVWKPIKNLLLRPRELVVSKGITKAGLCRMVSQRLRIGTAYGGAEDASKREEKGGDEVTEAELTAMSQAAAMVPHGVGVAAWTRFRGPLNKTTVLSLKWNEEMRPNTKATQKPLALRDGSVVVVRDEGRFALWLARNPKAAAKLARSSTSKRSGGRAGRSGPSRFREGRGVTIRTAFDRPAAATAAPPAATAGAEVGAGSGSGAATAATTATVAAPAPVEPPTGSPAAAALAAGKRLDTAPPTPPSRG